MGRPNRTTSTYPCRICGDIGYCYTLGSPSNPHKAFCMKRTSGARFINAKDNAGVYLLDGEPVDYEIVEAPLVAGDSRCANVYGDFLDLLTPAWETPWREDLERRGFTEADVRELDYRAPADQAVADKGRGIARRLVKLGHTLDNVPGFYFSADEWHAALHPGFFIPVRSKEAKLRRFQIRTPYEWTKYLWFSSDTGKAGTTVDGEFRTLGATSGAPAHFRKGESTTLYINEAPLKNDYMWLKTGRVRNCIGVGGVSTAHDEIAEETLDPHYNRAVICFDGNWRSNQYVALAVARLYRKIQRTSGLETTIAVWASEGGVDDALEQGLRLYESTYERWLANIPAGFRAEIKKAEARAEKVLDYA